MGRLFFSLLLIVTTLEKTHESCGIRKTSSQNLLEHEASGGEFPWQVVLKPNSAHTCSGTIIGEFWILSSAVCFTEMTTTILMIVGDLNLDFQGNNYPIRKLIRHVDTNENKPSDNSLALLKTSEPITFNDMVQPACYPSDDLLDVNLLVNCWVTTMKERTQDGYDNTKFVLKKTQFIPIQPCQFNNMTAIVCATGSNVESSDCTVSGGDALVCEDVRSKVWIVVGIAAFEKTQCNTTVIFARTASYITWLKESTEKEGKPILPEMYLVEPKEETTKKQGLSKYTAYYNEEFPSKDNGQNPEFKGKSNKESKLEAGKIMELSLFYTFLVVFTI